MGSMVLPHLRTGWHVDQAILSEEDRLVVIRFGKDGHPDCMRQDDVLARIADRVKQFAVVYLCDNEEVPDFNAMYELWDPMTVMVSFAPPSREVGGSRANQRLSFSGGTNTSCVILVPETTTSSRWCSRTSRKSSTSLRLCIGVQRRGGVWSLVQRITLRGIGIEFCVSCR